LFSSLTDLNPSTSLINLSSYINAFANGAEIIIDLGEPRFDNKIQEAIWRAKNNK